MYVRAAHHMTSKLLSVRPETSVPVPYSYREVVALRIDWGLGLCVSDGYRLDSSLYTSLTLGRSIPLFTERRVLRLVTAVLTSASSTSTSRSPLRNIWIGASGSNENWRP